MNTTGKATGEALLKPKSKGSVVLSTGLAMFAMFFGSGNIVYPLALGQFAQGKCFFGIIGLILTAVIVPLMGVMALLLYNGDYTTFFRRIGRVPGFLIMVMILGMIGPFGVSPRCAAVSYSTLSAFGLDRIPGMNLPVFSLFTCVLIYLFTMRQNKILTLLGYVLTPVLLFSLSVIVIKGLFVMPHAAVSDLGTGHVFVSGLLEGYNTLDLLAAFFFSSVVILCLRKGTEGSETDFSDNKNLLSIASKGGMIAASLLGIVYFCFAFLAAGFSTSLEGVANHQMLGALAYQLLGPYAGLVAGVAVVFAVFTTQIALTVVAAEFIHETLSKKKLSYRLSLILTLVVTFLVSTLRFEGINAFLVPMLKVCYPALIVLTILNICYKLFGFKPVKRLFYGTVLLTLITQFLLL